MEPLKFVALDKDDLAVVSDASAGRRGQGCRYPLAAAGKAAGARPRPFRLEGARPLSTPECAAAGRRCGSSACWPASAGTSIPLPARMRVLSLLAVEFEETAPPAGVVTLSFSGGPVYGSRSNAWRPNWPISGRRWATVAEFGAGGGAGLTPSRGTPLTDHADPSRQRERPISLSVSAPFSPPSARPPRTWSRRCAPSSPMWSRAATRRWSSFDPQIRPHRSARRPACASRGRDRRARMAACDRARARRAGARATTASRPITAASCPRTIASPTRSASSSAGAGPRSRRSASTCRAAPRPIRPRC